MRGGRRRDAGRLHRDARRSPRRRWAEARGSGGAANRAEGPAALLPFVLHGLLIDDGQVTEATGAADGAEERGGAEPQTQGDASARGGKGKATLYTWHQPGRSGPAEGARFWGGRAGNPVRSRVAAIPAVVSPAFSCRGLSTCAAEC